MEELKPYQIDDLYEMKWADEVVLHPSGDKVIYSVRWIAKEEDTYHSYLAWVDLKEKTRAVRLTYGKGRDRHPRFLPDGRTVAFISNREGVDALYELPLDGGEARRVTEIEGEVQRFFVTASGGAYVALVRMKPKEAVPQNDLKHLGPRVVERLRYKSDGRGLHDDAYSCLIWIERQGGKATILLDHLDDIGDVAVSLDGHDIAYTVNKSEDPDRVFRQDIVMARVIQSERGVKIGATSIPTMDWKEQYTFDALIFHPTQPVLFALGHDYTYAGATMPHLFAMSFQDPPQRLTQEVPFYFGDALIGDMVSGSAGPILRFSKDGNRLFAQISEHGNVHIAYADVSTMDAFVGSEGDTPEENKTAEKIQGFLTFETISFKRGHLYTWDVHPDGKTVFAFYSAPTHNGRLVGIDMETGTYVTYEKPNDLLERKRLVSQPDMFWISSFDETPLQGWLMRPVGFREDERYPLILTIHGGPHAMYGETFFHEFQILAGKGYGILYVNPRGSLGYGQTFVNAVRGDYGGNDMRDLMHALDVIIEREPWIDASRLAVMGGSYGGFMTNWIIGHSDRFRVAITDRSISNWLSFYGTSDIGTFFTEWEIGAHLYDDPERLWHHSPLKYASQVKTPVLIIHSEQDLRCPIEQAEQWFAVLKKLGKKVRFLRFPDSNHDLSRSGKPSLRSARLEAMVDWLDAHLNV